jgi:hypothetical protein
MSVFQAKKGESKPCVVIQEVLAVWWTRTRARPGEKVKVGAVVKDVKDGTKVEFQVVCKDEVLATINGKLQGGQADGDEWTIQLPERSWPDHVLLEVDCVVGDKLRSRKSQRPQLHVDLGLPVFSM